MKIGDLVRHKHLGGLGLIVGEKTFVSNITMGLAQKFIVKWLEDSSGALVGGDYFPAFLEPSVSADKNCPPK